MQLHSRLINEMNPKMPAALTRGESFCVANLLSKSCRSLQQKIRSCRRGSVKCALTAPNALAMEPRMVMLAGKTKNSVAGSKPLIILSDESTDTRPSLTP